MIVIPASLSSAFIHMAGMTIHIALESTIHIAGIRNLDHGDPEMLLFSMTRFFKFLPEEIGRASCRERV